MACTVKAAVQNGSLANPRAAAWAHGLEAEWRGEAFLLAAAGASETGPALAMVGSEAPQPNSK